MRQAVRAIGWATYILWLVIIVFTTTAVYSAFLVGEGVAFGEPRTNVSGRTMTMLLPFSLDNKGLYDISDMNITTIVYGSDGSVLSKSSTLVPLISSGTRVNASHNIPINIENMSSDNLSHLLFNDTDFNVDLSFALKYAGVIPLEISRSFTMHWGAPLHNLAISNISHIEFYNSTYVRAFLPMSFEDHSFFSLNGTIRAEVVNTLNRIVGVSATPINTPPKSSYSVTLEVFIPVGYGHLKQVRLYFNTSVFSYGPVVLSFG
jgi:hypothetical protein